MDVPRSRVEWLSPNIWYHTYYSKSQDQPWTSSPYWAFASWPYLTEYYQQGERLVETFGGHPLSAHFQVEKGSDYMSWISDLFSDAYGTHTLGSVDTANVAVYRNGSLIWNGSVHDAIWWYWWNDNRPASYRVVMDAQSSQLLSTNMRAEFKFTVSNSIPDCNPPAVYIRIPTLSMDCRYFGKEVSGEVVAKDESAIANVTLEYSIDDGGTWKQASLNTSAVPKTYLFQIKGLSGVFVSLRVNATDYFGNRVSQATIRGFYVEPFMEPYLVIREIDDRIWYRAWNATSWTTWSPLPMGYTPDSPAAAICNNELHNVVRGTDGGLWHSWITLSNGTFYGWYKISGATPSAPAIVASDGKLHLIVRGTDDSIWYRVYDCASRLWGSWRKLPGLTPDAPSAAALDGTLHIVVRGMGGGIWHGKLDLLTDTFLGWTRMMGDTPSRPALAADDASHNLILIVRGNNDALYYNVYSGSLWQGWNRLAGATSAGPAAAVVGDELHIVVKDMYSYDLWHYIINLSTNTHSEWTKISGTTPSAPTLTS
jgi:hypothetical protein